MLNIIYYILYILNYKSKLNTIHFFLKFHISYILLFITDYILY